VIGKFSEGNKEAIGETGVLVRVPRIEAARMYYSRSEEVEGRGRGLLGDGERCCKGGPASAGGWGKGKAGAGFFTVGVASDGISIDRRRKWGFSVLLSPRQLYESNKWVHTFIPEFGGASRLGSACSQGSAMTLSPLDFATSGESVHASPSLISARK
jgi:hypothetical protein